MTSYGVAFHVYVLCSCLTVLEDEQYLTYFTGMLCAIGAEPC